MRLPYLPGYISTRENDHSHHMCFATIICLSLTPQRVNGLLTLQHLVW